MSGYSCRGFSIATLRHVKHTTLIKKICRIVEHATTACKQTCRTAGSKPTTFVGRHVAVLGLNSQL